MILRTDTVGHFDNPTEEDIKKAISYPNGNFHENDIVKLMMNKKSYLAVWIGKKENGISKMVADGYSIEKILKELKKCEVLCANCHRKVHFKNNKV